MLRLTDQVLRSVALPKAGKRRELIDARCSGLAFRVSDQGARSFSFRFRDPKTRRVGRVTLGTYPDLSLSKAREKADELRGQSPTELTRQRYASANGIPPLVGHSARWRHAT